MKFNIPEVIFMSAFKEELPITLNLRRHNALKAILADLGVRYKICEGVYKNSAETSIMIYLEHYKGYNEHFFADIAVKQFDQESILYRDKYKDAYLIYKDSEEKIGVMREITPRQAESLDSFTRFPLTDTYLGVL